MEQEVIKRVFDRPFGVKQAIGVMMAVLVVIVSLAAPDIEGLTPEGKRVLGLTIAFLIMLVTEAIDMCVTCILFLGLLFVFNTVPSFSNALLGFSNQVAFFILASFGIAAAFTTIPLSKRILRALLLKFGKSVSSMLFAIMLCSALLSSFVSNVPTCAIFMSIALSFLELYKDERAKRQTARAFMIGTAVSSMIGGMITPVGSSINLLALDLLEEATGMRITFVQWMGIGAPLAVVMLPLAWFLCVKAYKPVEISNEQVRAFIEALDVPKRMGIDEKKVLLITAGMMALFVISSWVAEINIIVVCVIGCAIFFMPGVRVLEWKSFVTKDVSWDAYILQGAVISIGAVMVSNGVSDWFASLMPTTSNLPPMLLVGMAAAICFVALIIIPVAPAFVTFMIAPMIALGASWSPPAMALTLAFCAANCYLLPLDTVPMLTFSTGYYKMTDMARVTGLLQLIMIALTALWIPLACGFVGLI
ncbi:MAG: anion permease [Clostridiales Family XIII bacterium]|jgi:sodium-dependent dicarboxylate transporter 2/3/5|nr:anion permease [Clostridiales Family XIII bacterium]